MGAPPVSDRPADPSADDAAPATGTPSEDARRHTDGDRWQASVDSWSGGSHPSDGDGGTQEIRLDGAPQQPATDWPASTSWEQAARQPSSGSWEQTAQQPSADDRSWEQTSQEQIASWQQPPTWQQEAQAEAASRTDLAPADQPASAERTPSGEPVQPSGQGGPAAATWRPAEEPTGQPASWNQPGPWQSGPSEQQQWQPGPGAQQAWEPPPGARPWEGSDPQQPPAPQQQASNDQWGQQQSGGWGTQGSTSWNPGQQQSPSPQPPQPAGPPPSLTSQSLLRQTTETPARGWRRFVHKASGGTVNPGLSQAEIEHRALVQRVTTPVRGSNRIAVVSLKGGIGKTTTTCCLGLTLAHHRGDRVVAVDANPDAGTLAERLTNVTDVTVRDLLAAVDRIRSFTDVSAFTSLAGRLQVLASDQDPALSEAFSEEEYTTVADILARYFNLILTDSGTGLLHSAMSGTLAIADSLVVVGAPSVDGASRASKTLDWLIAHGHEELVARSVAVISSVRPNTGDVDMGMVRDHFAARCRAVVEIPYDAHLVTGGLIDLDRVGAPARKAYLELAAHVADGFALPPLQRKPAATA